MNFFPNRHQQASKHFVTNGIYWLVYGWEEVNIVFTILITKYNNK